MALSPSLVWEVRTTGDDTNGGGFDAATSGTDYSQQGVAQAVYADLTIDPGDATKVRSAGSPFLTAQVGNVLNIAGGPGFTVGRYGVIAVVAGVATLDRVVGTTGASGGMGKLGGALATLAAVATSMVPSNKAWIKSGTYSITVPLVFGQGAVSPSNTVMPTQVRGYDQARGDLYPGSTGTRPVLRCDADLGNSLLSFSNSGWMVASLEIAKGTGSFTRGVVVNSITQLVNIKVSGFADRGIYSSSAGVLVAACEITAGAAGSSYAINTGGSCVVYACHVHDNPCPGMFFSTSSSLVQSCLIANNSGANSHGVRFAGVGVLLDCTIRGNGGDAVRFTAGSYGATLVRNNIFAGNGGYGMNYSTGAGVPALWALDGNAYYNNLAGRFNFDDAGTVNPVNASGPYINSHDVGLAPPLSASPFVDPANGDFRLNDAAGAGGALRGVGVPRQWPGSAVLSYRDFGAASSQATTSGTIISFMGF